MSASDPAAWHAMPLAALSAELATELEDGLTPQEAERRLQQWGPNALQRSATMAPWALLLGQFQSLVIWVLIVAAVLSLGLGEFVDGLAILAIVVLNAVIGFFQEYRAEQAVAALARLTAPRARVRRGGRTEVIAATAVVPGDVLLLDAGDLIAADARVLEAAVLRSNEAPLTGESAPVAKRPGVCVAATPLAERHNMIYLGTSIANGSGRALVVATGMRTEVGHIAALLATARSDATPLQQRLDQVARRLLWACLGIVGMVFGLGLLRAVPLFELFLSAVSLAVAAIPEGLPAVVTVALALGVQRMVRRHALVRRLPAVETLGCAQVICSDKTGTLTVGAMTVRQVVTSAAQFTVSGEGYRTDGQFLVDGQPRPVHQEALLLDLLRTAAACNDAELRQEDGAPVLVGDPTEGALLVLAAKGGIQRADLEKTCPRVLTFPFDSDRKRMTVVRQHQNQRWAFVKGAPETILERCTQVRTGSGVQPFDAQARLAVLRTAALLAGSALRVLALAERPLPCSALSADSPLSSEQIEHDLIFLGLVGMQDPPRPEAREAIQRCKQAGIQVVMITGDHPDTARAVARELDILSPEQEVIAGAALDSMDDHELAQRVAAIPVYARVTAEHKLRIVRAWKARGVVVAMTGDGVNDAPALKEASIGVAMGITGTEVTKEAADLIITDDNFASIVAAVEEGRGIYDNIAKTLGYLLAGNAAELTVMFVAALLGWPLPLLPIQLLWINLVTDGLPALALGTDPIDPQVLNHRPRPAQAQLLDGDMLKRTVWIGCLSAAMTLTAFALAWHVHGDIAQARNAAFAVLVCEELCRALSARSHTRTIWEMGLFTNKLLLGIVVGSFALQGAIHWLPPLQRLFGTRPVSWSEGLLWLALGAVPMAILEGRKVWRRQVS